MKNSKIFRHHIYMLSFIISAFLTTMPSLPSNAFSESGESEMEKINFLKSLSLEDLAGLKVTSVSRKTEKLADTAAAVFVVTGEDIRRSGATCIPEALRMVPGIHVARFDTNKWAVTARGFNGDVANKLLVMIDGRSVYSMLWSGVFWNLQDTLLEDIDRIEVIRGPGASMWGANAVNGIINIITKSAKKTQGGLVSSGIGTEERGFANARYGMKPSENSYLRFYAKAADRDSGGTPDNGISNDQWSSLRGGFRFDWEPDTGNTLTLQGDLYVVKSGAAYKFASLTPPFYTDIVTEETDSGGGNLMMRWHRVFSGTSDMTLQVYYDHARMEDSLINDVSRTYDIDFHHRLEWNRHNEIVWGLGCRRVDDETEDVKNTRFIPQDRSLDLFSAFIQDQITLVPDRFWLILGSKFEHHTYTGWEIQPTCRFLWKPKENHSVWAAVSRAVRTPCRAERDLKFDLAALAPASDRNPGPLPVLVQVYGNEAFKSNSLTAFELGHRFTASDRIRWDAAVFYNIYNDLNYTVFGTPVLVPGSSPYVIAPQIITNDKNAETWGIEAALSLALNDWWRADLAYTYMKFSHYTGQGVIAGQSPENQISLKSSMDLICNIELDTQVRYVDRIKTPDIDHYITFDIRLGWHPMENLEVSLAGRNLAEKSHMEFSNSFFPILPTEVERSIYTKVTWTF